MENYLKNYKQQTLDKLIEARDTAKKQLELLKSIKRVYKKDWTEFQNLLKNFSSDLWEFRIYYWDMLYFEHYPIKVPLKMYYNLRYESDKREKYEKEAPERIVKEPCIVDRVFLNANELREEIQDRVLYYENYLKEQNENVKNFEKMYNKIEKVYWKLIDTINEANKTAQYEYKDMIKTCL